MSNMETKTNPLFADDFGASVTNDSIYRAFIMCQMGNDSNMARLKFFDPCGAATWYIADADLVYNDERDWKKLLKLSPWYPVMIVVPPTILEAWKTSFETFSHF